MIIKKTGRDRLTEKFSVMGSGWIKHFPPGQVFNVAQIDRNSGRFYAKEFGDWVQPDVPADEVEDQRKDA